MPLILCDHLHGGRCSSGVVTNLHMWPEEQMQVLKLLTPSWKMLIFWTVGVACRYPSWPAEADLRWEAAGGWTHAVRLQHPESEWTSAVTPFISDPSNEQFLLLSHRYLAEWCAVRSEEASDIWRSCVDEAAVGSRPTGFWWLCFKPVWTWRFLVEPVNQWRT